MNTGSMCPGSGANNHNYSILVVDDNPLVRYGIRQLLECEPDMTISAEIDCCNSAWALLSRQKITVLLLDLELHDGLAYRLIADIVNNQLKTKIMAYSANMSEWQVANTLDCGAHGLISKNVDPLVLREAIRAMIRCGSYYDSVVASLLVKKFESKEKQNKCPHQQLTKREVSVLNGIAEGKRNQDIAHDLYISERTVKYHLSSLFQKLQVHNRTEALKYAYDHDLLYK